MKRRLVWLALPLVLLALVLGVKWHADHPTATKEDLELRTMMSKTGIVDVFEDVPNQVMNERFGFLSSDEAALLLQDLYTTSTTSKYSKSGSIQHKVIHMEWRFSETNEYGIFGVDVYLNYDSEYGSFIKFESGSGTQEKYIHPVTAKRWLNFLLSHPQIGPVIETEMKN